MVGTIAGLGERALIERVQRRLPPATADVIISVGDDAAVVKPLRGEVQVLTTDTLVEGVHFDRQFCAPAEVGQKALNVNLSDLAAMGATPRLALLSLGLPDTLHVDAFDAFVEGFVACAARSGVSLVGGNITRSPHAWFITVTATGAAKARQVLTRSGGRPGDLLYVTGQLGAARAGLWWLQRSVSEAASGHFAEAVAAYQTAQARVREGVRAGRSRSASACMDLSDGLADAVTQVAEASGTGAEIDLASLPAHPSVGLAWPDEPHWQALLGGDDYELLFAVRPRRRRAFEAALGGPRCAAVTPIGRLTAAGEGLRVVLTGGTRAPLPRGYEHFAAGDASGRKDVP